MAAERTTFWIRHIPHQALAELSTGEWILFVLVLITGLIGVIGTLVLAWMLAL